VVQGGFTEVNPRNPFSTLRCEDAGQAWFFENFRSVCESVTGHGPKNVDSSTDRRRFKKHFTTVI